MRLYRIILWLLFAFLISGCAAPAPSTLTLLPMSLEPGMSIGQTFVARDNGLDGISVFLIPQTPGDGAITLRLFTDPQSPAIVTQSSLPVSTITRAAHYTFDVSRVHASDNQSYYFDLTLQGEGSLLIPLLPGTSYLDGAAYNRLIPQDAQTQFTLRYNAADLWLGRLQDVGYAALMLLLALLLFVLPGWGLLRIVWRTSHTYPWPTQMALGTVISLSLPILLMLWLELIGWRLGHWISYGLVIVALVTWAIHLWQVRTLNNWRHWWQSSTRWADGALVALLIVSCIVRLLIITPLEGPSWGDSLHHTMIAQLIMDNGGLFRSWQPYVPYTSLSVQYGFSANVAVFAWLTGQTAIQATLIVGQLLNGLALLAIYPLARRMGNDHPWAGIAAIGIAGLLSPIPAIYLNWGRYAQLTGQIFLPVVVWLVWDLIEQPRIVWRRALFHGFTLAGMALAYYRMPIYYALALVALGGCILLPRYGIRWRSWLMIIGNMGIAFVSMLLLLAPWVDHILGARLVDFVVSGITTRISLLEGVQRDYATWRDILLYVPLPLLILSIVGIVWAWVRRQWAVLTIVVWTAALAAFPAGQLLRIPGASTMQSFAVIIVLYLPVALIGGWFSEEISARFIQARSRYGVRIISITSALLVLVGIWLQSGIVQPSSVLLTRPDLHAFAWIRANTPPDALILVEGFRISNGRSAVGSDGGWWIPLLAQRQTTMPPQYALLNERPDPPNYSKRIVELVAFLETRSIIDIEVMRMLCDYGVTHIYVGQGNGLVSAGSFQLFSAPEIAQSSYYELLYQRDRVAIFALRAGVCTSP